jgi:hypothetical protein
MEMRYFEVGNSKTVWLVGGKKEGGFEGRVDRRMLE